MLGNPLKDHAAVYPPPLRPNQHGGQQASQPGLKEAALCGAALKQISVAQKVPGELPKADISLKESSKTFLQPDCG